MAYNTIAKAQHVGKQDKGTQTDCHMEILLPCTSRMLDSKDNNLGFCLQDYLDKLKLI
jgi:hypothetical protein